MAKPPKHRNPPVSELIGAYNASRRVGSGQLRALELIDAHFGRYTADRIENTHVLAYHKRRRMVAESTRRRELGALVAVLNWAARGRLIARDSVPYIDLPPPGAPRQLFMTEPEARAFEAAAWASHEASGHCAATLRVAVFISLALHTGARKEAILQLTWDRVHLAGRTVNYQVAGATLTRKRRAKVPLNDDLFQVLSSLAQNPCDTSNLVVGQGSIRNGYERFTRSISMTWVTPHVLRHTAASLMLAKGIPTWEVGQVLGDTPETIARVYGHSTTRQLQAAVNALGRDKGQQHNDGTAGSSSLGHAH